MLWIWYKSNEGLTWKAKGNGKETQFITHCGVTELKWQSRSGFIKGGKVKNDSKVSSHWEKESSNPSRDDKKKSMFKEEDKLGSSHVKEIISKPRIEIDNELANQKVKIVKVGNQRS